MYKICFVTTVYLTFHCFLKNFSEYLFRSDEYDISLICNPEEGLEKDLPRFVHYYPVKMERGISLSALSAVKEIKHILMEQHFDIVQYSTPNAAFYTSIAAKKAKTPVRLYCQWGIRYMGFEGIRRSIFKYLEKKTCRNSTYIEAESHNIRRFSLQEKLYDENKSCVIWNGSASGVDLTKFDISKKPVWRKDIREKYGINYDEVVFAFAGRLTADKGVNELLEAFRTLSSVNKKVRLMIMGGIDNRSTIKDELYAFAENSDQVILTGSVDDIERYYAASDVFVAPSYREGFGLVVVEAEAMGLPAIVSDVPGQVDAIMPNVTGLLCAVKDSVSLCDAMTVMTENSEQRKEMSQSALNFAISNFEQNQLFSFLKIHRDELIGLL